MIARDCIAVRYHVARTGFRWRLSLTTQLAIDDRNSIWVRLGNLSTTGFMAECKRAILPGQPVRIVLPGAGVVPATVRWSKDGRIGCQFVHRLGGADVAYEVLCAFRGWVRSRL